MPHALIVDTNVLVRLATNDIPGVAAGLLKEITGYTDGSILLSDAVFAELIFVLSSPRQYAQERSAVLDICTQILAIKQFACDREVLGSAVATFATTKFDFVDCLIIAQHNLGRASKVLSLDKPLLRFADTKQV